MSNVAKLSFEDAMSELETLVKQLESGTVPLAESIKLYERGDALKKHCEAKLAEAEEKVAQITKGADGAATGATPAHYD
jgi:exodeoxyribonuclease VII small subunit